MKPKFWQTNEFRRLETEWYRKLEQNKFDDIEKQVNGDGALRQRASNCYRNTNQVERENKLRYYELLSQAFHDEKFEDGIEQLIMQRKANGATIAAISKELEQMNERCYRGTIRLIIQKYEKKWEIKKR